MLSGKGVLTPSQTEENSVKLSGMGKPFMNVCLIRRDTLHLGKGGYSCIFVSAKRNCVQAFLKNADYTVRKRRVRSVIFGKQNTATLSIISPPDVVHGAQGGYPLRRPLRVDRGVLLQDSPEVLDVVPQVAAVDLVLVAQGDGGELELVHGLALDRGVHRETEEVLDRRRFQE